MKKKLLLGVIAALGFTLTAYAADVKLSNKANTSCPMLAYKVMNDLMNV